MKIIDFEAHFFTKGYVKTLYENQNGYPRYVDDEKTQSRQLWYNATASENHGDGLLEKLTDIGELRIKHMDEAGIDVQVLSLSAPGVEGMDPAMGTAMAKNTNNELAEAVNKYPDRFLGFAALAPQSPQEAATELERAVKVLGLVGWKTHSNYGDTYLDNKKYWPILAKAAELDVPIYLHPTVPAIPQLGDYGYALAGAAFGFGFETAMCMMRLILSGAFDQFPNLKIMLGHYGEALPFLMTRIDWPYVRPYNPASRPDIAKKPSEYLSRNVYVTTSGNYFEPAFTCTAQALGIDNIFLGTDYPYEDSDECMRFLEGLPISQEEKDKVYSLNAGRIGVTV